MYRLLSGLKRGRVRAAVVGLSPGGTYLQVTGMIIVGSTLEFIYAGGLSSQIQCVYFEDRGELMFKQPRRTLRFTHYIRPKRGHII